MAVEVSNAIVIDKPVAEVAGYAADPDRAPRWYANIDAIEWETEPPLKVGSRLAFRARFMGRQLAYTYEVVEFVPGERLVMRTAQGPFPMETIYEWREAGAGKTEMRLTNRGEPKGFAAVTAPLMASAMNAANRKDLAAVKRILESG